MRLFVALFLIAVDVDHQTDMFLEDRAGRGTNEDGEILKRSSLTSDQNRIGVRIDRNTIEAGVIEFDRDGSIHFGVVKIGLNVVVKENDNVAFGPGFNGDRPTETEEARLFFYNGIREFFNSRIFRIAGSGESLVESFPGKRSNSILSYPCFFLFFRMPSVSRTLSSFHVFSLIQRNVVAENTGEGTDNGRN